ncbi:MAG: hypothetical protein QM658_02365 [Gordonia sp. (in: high G+C Gram-positive bacteria)]
MLDELEAQARSEYAAGEYTHALADFSVLREIRSRREGPYSVKYLRSLHDCVRCMRHLQLWRDSDLLCSELYSKYLRTHGRGETDTVDVAKHWAWAMVNLADYPSAVRLYLATADALWDVDHHTALRLLGAAAAHIEPEHEAVDGLAGITLAHTTDLAASFDDLAERLGNDASARASITFDGLALAE